MAVHTRDSSLAGFSNGSHHWHAFPGHEGAIPGATTFPFGDSYRDLIGGFANLPRLALDPAAYDPSTTASAVAALTATFKVTPREAVRLRPVKVASRTTRTLGEAHASAASHAASMPTSSNADVRRC